MDQKDDEEISIDFTKIKSFFKKNEDEKKPETAASKSDVSSQPEAKDKSDDEISIDFSKIKNIFKAGDKSEKADDDFFIEWSKAGDFFRKYGIVFLALIPIILSIYIRLQAGNLNFADDWASNSVINNIRSQVASTISQQYPNLPDANKNVLVDAEMRKVLSQNKQQIGDQIKATSQYIKSFFQGEDGKNYMADIDPYYWVRYANNILDHGYPGDILKDGKSFDTYQLAPLGRFVMPDMLHSYAIAYFHKITGFFLGVSLMKSSFYMTIFVSAICVLLVFLIARRIAGNTGGFFAALIMSVTGGFLSRTLHPDNDIWVVFFPLVVTWLFVVTEESKSLKKIVLTTSLAGLFTGLFTFAWSGWWYIFDFILATIFATFVYFTFINLKEVKSIKIFFSNELLKNLIIMGVLYFLSTALFTILFSGWPTFRESFLGPLSFPSIKAPVTRLLWPNVLTTVAELNEGSLNGIINSVGGPLMFYIGLLGLVFSISRGDGWSRFDQIYILMTAFFYGALFIRTSGDYLYNKISIITFLVLIILPIIIRMAISLNRKETTYDYRLPLLLSLWVISTIFAGIKGIRFTLLLAPAFSVAFGVGIGKLFLHVSKWASSSLKIHKGIVSVILLIAFFSLFYIKPIKAAQNTANYDIPIINDAWFNTLDSIKLTSGKNAIITSWWDFGHHFKFIADRPVTFDGTTQTDAAAHWVGRFFMTDNEREAIGILRMLDCGHNRAFVTLNEDFNFHRSMKLLREVILLEKNDARKILLNNGVSNEKSEKIMQYTHCENPPEAFIIASEDMIGKSGVWGHFGSWNFERADLWYNVRKMDKEKAIEYMVNNFNYSKEKAEDVYFEIQSIASDSEANSWVAPWPGYGGTQSCTKNKEGIFVCENGLQINTTTNDIFGLGQQGIVRPKVAVFTTDTGTIRKDYDKNTIDLGVTVIPESEEEYTLVLSSKELAGSMFTRMFYMRGHGLRYFDLSNHQRGLTGTDIYTYKVDWKGTNATIEDKFVIEKPQVISAVSNNS